MAPPPVIVLIMGVSGSGKSTVGRMVADKLGWPYFEADDFHSAANKSKMARGLPLDDADRAPWLASIRARMDECRKASQSAIFTCSALKEKYRSVLGGDTIILVHLTGDLATILQRVGQRQGHYMKSDLVRSQFEALEPPANALVCDISHSPEEIVETIVERIRYSVPGPW
ncbi:MAG TPA: gluconokinase [Candidatus Didemnitutus sp.]|jgi:gluconokinase